MGNLCRRNVELFLNLEHSRLRKARKCIFGLCGWTTTTPRMHLHPSEYSLPSSIFSKSFCRWNQTHWHWSV